MRIALFSDVHGNYYALKAVLQKIMQLSAVQSVDQIYCLGDILFGHAGGNAVMDLLDEYGVHLIRGNHDESQLPVERLGEDRTGILLAVHDWMKQNILPEHLLRLDTLPISTTILLEDGRKLCLFHSNPADLWDVVNASDPDGEDLMRVFGGIEADVIAYGHYHQEHVMSFNHKLLINVASVDSFVREEQDGLARFTLLTSQPDRLVIQRYVAAYDTEQQKRMNREFNAPTFFDSED